MLRKHSSSYSAMVEMTKDTGKADIFGVPYSLCRKSVEPCLALLRT